MIPITPVILCGGSGTRLWPLSRSGFPKQFLSLTGDASLFQSAVERLQGLENAEIDVGETLVVTNEAQRFLASEQLRELGVSDPKILLEPVGRNTAPAMTLASLIAMESQDDPVLVVTPADQTIQDVAAFTTAVQQAIKEAQEGSIVILGIRPLHAETGYGYIKAETADDGAVPTVVEFVEKPDQKTAEMYLADGRYFWNAGMFVVKASVWINALQTHRNDIFEATQAACENCTIDAAFVRPDATLFEQIPSESIDYAVMERCPGTDINVKMAVLSAGWSDLGAWEAVWETLPKDEKGNAHTGDEGARSS